MEIGKRMVGHEKQLHEMTIPSKGLWRVLRQVPAKNCVQISSEKVLMLVSALFLDFSLSIEFGLKSCKPAKKSKLTCLMEKKRLEFARNHLHWTFDG